MGPFIDEGLEAEPPFTAWTDVKEIWETTEVLRAGQYIAAGWCLASRFPTKVHSDGTVGADFTRVLVWCRDEPPVHPRFW